jgi:hypothetical protein
MPTIEPYMFDDEQGPRTCARADMKSATKCTAEMILRDEQGTMQFLCKHHANQILSGSRTLLASAVIELALKLNTTELCD